MISVHVCHLNRSEALWSRASTVPSASWRLRWTWPWPWTDGTQSFRPRFRNTSEEVRVRRPSVLRDVPLDILITLLLFILSILLFIAQVSFGNSCWLESLNSVVVFLLSGFNLINVIFCLGNCFLCSLRGSWRCTHASFMLPENVVPPLAVALLGCNAILFLLRNFRWRCSCAPWRTDHFCSISVWAFCWVASHVCCRAFIDRHVLCDPISDSLLVLFVVYHRGHCPVSEFILLLFVKRMDLTNTFARFFSLLVLSYWCLG